MQKFSIALIICLCFSCKDSDMSIEKLDNHPLLISLANEPFRNDSIKAKILEKTREYEVYKWLPIAKTDLNYSILRNLENNTIYDIQFYMDGLKIEHQQHQNKPYVQFDIWNNSSGIMLYKFQHIYQGKVLESITMDEKYITRSYYKMQNLHYRKVTRKGDFVEVGFDRALDTAYIDKRSIIHGLLKDSILFTSKPKPSKG